MNCKFSISLLTAFVLVAGFAQATKMTNLGVVGGTYPVVESDVVVELRQEAAKKNKNDTPLFELMKGYQPANLHTLPPAEEDKIFLVDMSYTLDRELVDLEGKVLYPRGYTFNPLDYLAFPGGLVVIDGADPAQVKWFKKTPYAKNNHARLLLSNGYAFELIRQLKRPVFYLTGDIAKRLQLKAVPSIVIQQDDKMLVREILISVDTRQGESDD